MDLEREWVMPGIPGQGKGRVLSEEWRTKIRAGLARYWARHRMPMEERLRRSNERGRRWAQEHGGLDGIYKRRHHLRTYYGLTLEEYDALYAAQNGCCAMCRQPRRILEVDHCHSTGKVRGLLCPSRSEEHTSELQSQSNLVCRLLLEKKK